MLRSVLLCKPRPREGIREASQISVQWTMWRVRERGDRNRPREGGVWLDHPLEDREVLLLPLRCHIGTSLPILPLSSSESTHQIQTLLHHHHQVAIPLPHPTMPRPLLPRHRGERLTQIHPAHRHNMQGDHTHLRLQVQLCMSDLLYNRMFIHSYSCDHYQPFGSLFTSSSLLLFTC